MHKNSHSHKWSLKLTLAVSLLIFPEFDQISDWYRHIVVIMVFHGHLTKLISFIVANVSDPTETKLLQSDGKPKFSTSKFSIIFQNLVDFKKINFYKTFHEKKLETFSLFHESSHKSSYIKNTWNSKLRYWFYGVIKNIKII